MVSILSLQRLRTEILVCRDMSIQRYQIVENSTGVGNFVWNDSKEIIQKTLLHYCKRIRSVTDIFSTQNVKWREKYFTSKYVLPSSLYPPLQRSWKGVYWFYLVRLSVCPSVDIIVSALYLQQCLSDPFHICTSYKATSEGVSCIKIVSKFLQVFYVTLTLSFLTWDPIWLNRVGNHEAAGVSSERRRSSCSSLRMIWVRLIFLQYTLPNHIRYRDIDPNRFSVMAIVTFLKIQG